ncbi:type II secretion system F family protein [Massilia terrae]|uniref:Type II secretion system F family protein n=2 Tax=Massilia terrae TaxID=1811224 RepID=A0ABT2CX47_9BURK|nr:type II secretion system F family protein [Massilia terrae]MCS0658560.1 type II secretion system F family protein [Massilia terrae]
MIFAFLITISVTAALAGVFMLARQPRIHQRMSVLYQPSASPGWTNTMAQLVGPFARLSLPGEDWETSPLRLRFIHAGIRHPDAKAIYFGLKTVLPLFAGVIAWLALRESGSNSLDALFGMLLAALIGVYTPNLVLAWWVRVRRRELFEAFPDAADLMLVCVEAGHGLDGAMQRIAEEIRHRSLALAEELYLTNLELRAGAGRDQALRNLARRTGIEEVGAFAAMLIQADRFGTSIGDSLRVFSDDLRHKRLVRAEELAAKVPTKMLLPLVILVFPSVIMVILGPAIITIIRSIPAMLGIN